MSVRLARNPRSASSEHAFSFAGIRTVVENPPALWNGPVDRLFATLLRSVSMMSEEGVPIMTGLDTARGKTIADEIEVLVRAGTQRVVDA